MLQFSSIVASPSHTPPLDSSFVLFRVLVRVPPSQDSEHTLGVSAINGIGTGSQLTGTEWTRPPAPTQLGVGTVSGDSLILSWALTGQSTSTFTLTLTNQPYFDNQR